MMKMKMNSGSFIITDDNQTMVSRDVADAIQEGMVDENGKVIDGKKPTMTIINQQNDN